MTVRYGTSSQELQELFEHDARTRVPSWTREWDDIPPVWSGGQTDHPDFALVYINPTYRNQAARDSWPDELRAPHIGFRRAWEFFQSCGLMTDFTLALPEDGKWKQSTAAGVYKAAALSGIYVTNLVKACGSTSEMPSMPFARQYHDLLCRELAIVKPKTIITMGSLVTSVMTGTGCRIRDVYDSLMASGQPMRIATTSGIVIPSYFPGGRGEPRKAREIISAAVARCGHDHGPEMNCQACYYGEPSQWSIP